MLGSSRLFRFFKRDPDVSQDGFGQSLLDDIRFMQRFRSCRNARTTWRLPTREEDAGYESHPIVRRFGDSTEAIASVDDRTWIVRERTFNGWPDPPRFAFFALDRDGTIWAAVDFHQWPGKWTISRDHWS
jgi:hypothetical protein